MGDVVRPNFRHKHTSGEMRASNEREPAKVYGFVKPYQVVLYCDDLPDVFPTFRIKLIRSDTGEAFSLATLPLTQESCFQAHAIAAAVLEALRLAAFTKINP